MSFLGRSMMTGVWDEYLAMDVAVACVLDSDTWKAQMLVASAWPKQVPWLTIKPAAVLLTSNSSRLADMLWQGGRAGTQGRAGDGVCARQERDGAHGHEYERERQTERRHSSLHVREVVWLRWGAEVDGEEQEQAAEGALLRRVGSSRLQ